MPTQRRGKDLMQELNNLEKEWESLEKSKPRIPYRCSRVSSDAGCIVTRLDHLLETSPRVLMYSLQDMMLPDDGIFRPKKVDVAMEEILRDRRLAIMSGKIKGRQLFRTEEEEDAESELVWTVEENGLAFDEKNKERRSFDGGFAQSSCSITESSLSEAKAVAAEEEEKAVVEVCRSAMQGDEKRTVAVFWFALLLILFIFGLICLSCNGTYVHEHDKLNLVPT